MNSLKSACSFAKKTPVPLNQLQENVESFLWCQVGVELIISHLGVFKTAGQLNDSFHRTNFSTQERPVPPLSLSKHRRIPAGLLTFRIGCPRNQLSCRYSDQAANWLTFRSSHSTPGSASTVIFARPRTYFNARQSSTVAAGRNDDAQRAVANGDDRCRLERA